jgi:hypothetical protein
MSKSYEYVRRLLTASRECICKMEKMRPLTSGVNIPDRRSCRSTLNNTAFGNWVVTSVTLRFLKEETGS